MSQSKKAAKAVLIMIIFTFGSKILGFIREQLIAAKFGSDARTDTFFIAISAVSLFTSMIASSVSTTMIPVLSEVDMKEGKKGKREHTNNLLNIVVLISIVVMILAWVLAPIIMKILAAGFGDDQFKQAVLMMRIGLPAIIFAGIVGVFRGYLQSELMFTESALSNFPYNFTYIFFLVFLSVFFGLKGLMVTSVLAVIAQITIQIPGIRKTGYRYKYILDFKDKYTKKTIYLIPPILGSVVINDINKIIDKSLGSTLEGGSISALNYASRLDGLTTGIFIAAIMTVVYPMLSNEANKENKEGLKKVISRSINIILLIIIPATIGMILLANPVVRVAFQRGEFDPTATYMTAGALVFYSVGLIGTAFKSLLTRVYYSLHDTKTPMINSVIAVGINVVFNFILIGSMAHKGLALATSISAIITSLFLLYGLQKKIGSFGLSKSVKCGLKSLIASIVMGVAVYFLHGTLDVYLSSGTIQELLALIISAGVGVLIYFILVYLFKVEEIDWVVGVIKSKFRV